MSPRTLTRGSPPGRVWPTSTPWPTRWLMTAAVIVAAGIVIGRLTTGPAVVAQLSVANPTAYDITVEVSGGDGEWTVLGTVDRRSSATFADVVEQGSTWTFLFHGQGAAGGSASIGRDQLRDAGWRLDIPTQVGDRLATAGAPPTPY